MHCNQTDLMLSNLQEFYDNHLPCLPEWVWRLVPSVDLVFEHSHHPLFQVPSSAGVKGNYLIHNSGLKSLFCRQHFAPHTHCQGSFKSCESREQLRPESSRYNSDFNLRKLKETPFRTNPAKQQCSGHGTLSRFVVDLIE